MILKSIDMQGFKSFPDKVTLELGKGITGVVGPNGSGKSNISDAVRWVLGEQSTKALRGSRMEDVIFGGTSRRKALGYAEVTLRLDNKDRSLPRDVDEVAVTRRYYRSGESEYKINGEECRLRDIHEMFMDTGLGRDGYSMVSQGKIADLVSAKSSQRRDMLEEAAGISHFRYRRADANRRLDQAEENLVRLRDILAELESRIGPLKIQSEKAIKFLALSDEKKTLEIGLWLHTIEKASNGLREQEVKLSIASQQYSDAEKKLNEIETEIEAALQQSQDLTLEIERLTKFISESEEQAAVIDGNIAVKNNTIEHNKTTIERLNADMGSDEESAAEIDEEIEKANEAIAQKEEEIKARRAELETELTNLNTLLGQNGQNSEKAREVNEKLTAATMELSDLRVEKSSALSTAEELKTRIATIDDVIETRGSILDTLEEEKGEAEKNIRHLKDEKQENENACDGYRLIIETREGKAEKLRKEVEDLNLNIYQKNARIKMLDDLEKNLDGYAGSVQKIIKESNRGAMKGIHGTVSQLITTKAEYATAVETALGNKVQNIITDDENVAKKAIAYLKDNRAGRATFLPITTVTAKPFTEKGLEKHEGYINMACELVECDKKYREIIKSLLGRIAVVETIDDAIAMAKSYSYRFEIVTLDGQVLNAGGSMTGGSRGSGAGLLSRVNEIEELKEKVAALEKTLAEKQKAYDTVAGEINTAQAELDASEAEIIKVDEKIIRAESDLQVIEDRYASAKGHIDDLMAEKEKSTLRIKECEETEKTADKSIAVINSKIDKLNDELISLDQQRESIEELKEKSADIQSDLNIKIVTLNKEIEAHKDIIKAARIRKEALASRGNKLNEEIARITFENEVLAKEVVDLKANAQALRDGAKETDNKISDLVKQRDDNSGDSAKLRVQEREMSAEREKLGGELARLGERRDNLERELETTKNKLYDEYQLTYSEAQEVGEVPEDIGKAQRTLQEIKGKIRGLGNVNVGAVEEYKEVSERYEYMNGQLTDVEKSKQELEKLIDELTGKMAEKFREQFRRINVTFGETFKDLFDGGRAELVLDDPTDVLECNINIKVQPPGKNVQNIDLLSGGEKGLAAIALLFAILKITPAPFCIFDEVEAALDDVNVSRYARYVRNMTNNTQFILITHRRGTMDEADVLYGVTMQEEGVSKMLELKSSEMARKLGLEN
ncbi:MAG: chromosome segregation protein SMC [Clostridia bacterium]|nr:chromosome segregation protein SMC [Clostridia bacterium]